MRLAVVVVLLACAACRRESETRAPQQVWLTDAQMQDAKIVVAPVEEHEVDVAFATSGHLAFDDSRVAHVYSEVAGRVLHIDAALGQQVKRGDALATIDSPEVGAASADLRKAEADLAATRHTYQREKNLFEKQAASRAEFERAQDDYLRQKAEYQRVKQKLELFLGAHDGHITQHYVLTSPIDGEVLARAISPGVEVQGLYSGGSPGELFTIGALDRVWVLADVYEADLDRVKGGAPVQVTVVAYPNDAFRGNVDWISNVLDPATRTAAIRCALDNRDGKLKPGMYATVSISAVDKKALAVPRDAVVRIGDQAGVFVAGDPADGRTRFEYRPVAVDEHEGSPWVVVQRGVGRGTRVVVSGGAGLSEMF